MPRSLLVLVLLLVPACGPEVRLGAGYRDDTGRAFEADLRIEPWSDAPALEGKQTTAREPKVIVRDGTPVVALRKVAGEASAPDVIYLPKVAWDAMRSGEELAR